MSKYKEGHEYGIDQREDMLTVVGQQHTHNWSPTLQAKLLKVNKNTCTFRIVESEYPSLNVGHSKRIGNTFLCPIYISWNTFFY